MVEVAEASAADREAALAALAAHIHLVHGAPDEAAARAYRKAGVAQVEAIGRMEELSAALPCHEGERAALAEAMKARPVWLAAAVPQAEEEAVIREAGWAICMDVDEFINIKIGDGTLGALYAALGDANMISLTWRLFGDSGVAGYEDRFLLDQFTRCAPEIIRKPPSVRRCFRRAIRPTCNHG